MHRPQLAHARKQLAEQRRLSRVPPHVALGDHETVALCLVLASSTSLGMARVRLLAEHVLACRERAHRPLVVESVRQRDVDGIDVGIGEELFVRGVGALDPVRVRVGLRAGGVPRADGHDAERRIVGTRVEDRAVDAGGAEEAEADDGHSGRVFSLVDQDALRRRARAGLAAAPERAGARAHFRAMGIDPTRLDGPIVGVASTWTGTMPCNLNQLELSRHVCAGVDGRPAACRSPFNTIAVSDNQSQGTPGMRASLISREVIADSIELMIHAHDFDALVCLVGCDKTVPAALMALARLDKPAVVLYSGPMRAGAGATSRSRTSGRRSAPRSAALITARRARRARARRLPRRRHVRRPLHGEHDGRRARVPRHRAARRRAGVGGRPGDKGAAARRAGALAARRLSPLPARSSTGARS